MPLVAGGSRISLTDDIDGEGGPIEAAQVALWAFAAVIALTLAWRLRDKAARWFTVWLGVLASLAAARELDLHVKLNPETLGDWGVRYRLDWWTDGSVSIGLKLMWFAIASVIGAAFIIPMLRAGTAVKQVLLRQRAVPILGAACLAMLFVGWASDDLLRQWTSKVEGVLVEEGAELIGVCCFALAVILLLTPKTAPIDR